MKNSLPHSRLISVAAELVRGQNLAEWFDIDRLPKWARDNIEKVSDRQKELAVVIRENADQLRQELVTAQETIARLEKENNDLKLSLSSGGGKPSSAGPVLNAMKDRIAELKAKALELEGVRACSCDPSPEEKEIMRIIDEKY